MSNANVTLVQAAYAAFGKGDIEAVVAMLAPDIRFGIVGREQDAPFLGIHHGHAGAAEFFRRLDAAHAISMFEPLRYAAAEDDKVFVWGHYTWTMRQSGVSDTTRWLHEFTIRDGRVCEWLGHNDTAMLAAAYHGATAHRAATDKPV